MIGFLDFLDEREVLFPTMGSRNKEDERTEKAIRSLLKLPENRRCINCNSLVHIFELNASNLLANDQSLRVEAECSYVLKFNI